MLNAVLYTSDGFLAVKFLTIMLSTIPAKNKICNYLGLALVNEYLVPTGLPAYCLLILWGILYIICCFRDKKSAI